MPVGFRRSVSVGLVSLCALVLVLFVFSAAAVAAPEAPTVSEESFSGVSSTEATLSAQINPGGLPTTYHVEYGASTPEQSLAASSTPVGVQVRLTGLHPATEYHFRFLADNAAGPGEGAEASFTTNAVGGSSALILPDNRAYELVSPPHSQSNQEVHTPIIATAGIDEEDLPSEELFRTSPDGNVVAYAGDPPSSSGNGSQGKGNGNQYLAVRTAQGWEASDVTPTGSSIRTSYQAFSSDLSTGIVTSPNNPETGTLPLTEDAPVNCPVLYSRIGSGYRALFTTTETPGFCGNHLIFAAGNEGTAAAPEYSHLLFETEAALTQPAVAAEPEEYNLYESVAGELRLVNILPGGESDPDAMFGGPSSPQSQGAAFEEENQQPDFSNTISADGSRIFWTDRRTGDLYVREDGAITVPVSAGLEAARFWTATPDGKYVYYTEGEKLWRFDVEGKMREELVGAGGNVQGVIGINETGEDGSYVYFVAGGALTGNENSEKEKATLRDCKNVLTQEEEKEETMGHFPAGKGCNLYVLRAGEAPTFIGTLSAVDNSYERSEHFHTGDWQANLGNRTAEVTPDGRHLAFMSRRPLTGYDSVMPTFQLGTSIEAAPETFVYDADSGRISCASCNPTGEPPTKPQVFGRQPLGGGAYEPIVWNEFNSNTFMHRWINEEGTEVFFSTAEPLVSQDTNGHEDVYEWEREGSHSSCPEETPARANGGCVFLLSGGSSADASSLADVSASGDDVFFTTRGQLVPQDRNEDMDLYDARVGGGFPESSLACTGTGCQGLPLAPPIFATPSSVTFSGVGNFEAPAGAAVKPKPKAKPKRCKRGFVKKHGKCVKNAKKASKRSKRGRK